MLIYNNLTVFVQLKKKPYKTRNKIALMPFFSAINLYFCTRNEAGFIPENTEQYGKRFIRKNSGQ